MKRRPAAAEARRPRAVFCGGCLDFDFDFDHRLPPPQTGVTGQVTRSRDGGFYDKGGVGTRVGGQSSFFFSLAGEVARATKSSQTVGLCESSIIPEVAGAYLV